MLVKCRNLPPLATLHPLQGLLASGARERLSGTQECAELAGILCYFSAISVTSSVKFVVPSVGACHDQVREGFTRGELSFGRAAVIVVLDAHKPGEGWATGAAAHTRPKHCSGAGYHSQTCVIKA